MFSWIRHYVAEVDALPSALLVCNELICSEIIATAFGLRKDANECWLEFYFCSFSVDKMFVNISVHQAMTRLLINIWRVQ